MQTTTETTTFSITELYADVDIEERVKAMVVRLMSKKRHKKEWQAFSDLSEGFRKGLTQSQQRFYSAQLECNSVTAIENYKVYYRVGLCCGAIMALTGLNLLDSDFGNGLDRISYRMIKASACYAEHWGMARLYDDGLRTSLSEEQKEVDFELSDLSDSAKFSMIKKLERVGRRDGFRLARERGIPSVAYLLGV